MDTNDFSIFNLISSNIQLFFFFIFIWGIGLIILFIIGSYLFIKFLKMGIDDNNILFYRYNQCSQKILDLYGNNKVTNIYLVRRPISGVTSFILNIITLYNYNKLINDSNQSPYHVQLIFEIKLTNGYKKLLLLEKNNSVNISERINVSSLEEIIRIKTNKQLTLNNILKTTQHRIGTKQFFNWHIYKNNCKSFIKELLKTIGIYKTKHKNFIFGDIPIDKLINVIVPTELASHIVNSLVNIVNLFEKICYK